MRLVNHPLNSWDADVLSKNTTSANVALPQGEFSPPQEDDESLEDMHGRVRRV
jgi:hypothetical protein